MQRLILAGLDGFRFDYAERYDAQNLLEFRKSAAAAGQMIPVFPSTTFPNFYSMATGLLPARHGIVAMNFWDNGRMFFYQTTASDGSWYRGTPLWLLAEQHGIQSAAFFWPGSDAAIQGRHATYFRKYDGRVTHEERLAALAGWLKDPNGPRFITMYFSDADSAGHRFGPDSGELRQAVLKVDATMGKLLAMADSQTNVVIVSDHGMQAVEKYLDLTAEAGFSQFQVANEAPMTQLYSGNRALVETTFSRLRARSQEYEIFRRDDLPAEWKYTGSRVGDLLLIPKGPYIIQVRVPGTSPIPALKGMHGYDPAEYPLMGGIFMARGPGVRSGARLASLRTPDVFAMAVALLGLDMPPDLDTSLSAVAPLLSRP